MANVEIADRTTGALLKCRTCGQQYNNIFEQYVICGCQDRVLEANGAATAAEIPMPVRTRNTFVQLMTLARACQQLVPYIPGMANVSPG